MGVRKKKRRMKYLMHKHHLYGFNQSKAQVLGMAKQAKKEGWVDYGNTIAEKAEIYKLGDKLGMTEGQILGTWMQISFKKFKTTNIYDLKPLGETRDNKKTLNIGSGWGNGNSIRYPSKKRSRKTWANFYALFPHLAEKDGWNGKTSKRMK